MLQKMMFILMASLGAFVCTGEEKIAVRSGEKILFLGDSITQFGNRKDGFVRQTMDGLKQAGIKNLTFIPGGVSGNRTVQVLQRLPALLKQKPDWVILQIGVNDVNWGKNGGVKLPQYKINIQSILGQCAKINARVVLVTPSLCREKLSFPNNKILDEYCAYLRQEAVKRKLILADWNRNMQTLLRSGKVKGDPDRVLTIDGLHLNGYGNMYLAQTILRALGVSEKTIAALEISWKKVPSMAPVLNSWSYPGILISMDDFETVRKAAQAKKLTVKKYMEKVLYDHVRELKKAGK
ncbi:MAG: hypothetical protein J6S58_08205 [Lentisphaeria bacterium]|nr:hypothetical protein [Lentisphaeria bacterium]